MIQAANRILINNTGPAPFLFDIDTLHDRLTASFNACGIMNSWMADDILIAVHSCLNPDNKPLSEESMDQLNASLIKILRDNGFPEVADHFCSSLQNSSVSELLKKINSEINQLNCSLPGNITQKVLNKVLSLGYPPEKISSLLIREICLLESERPRKEEFDDPKALEFMPFDSRYVNWDWDILSMKAAGHLFYSVRVDLHPVKLADTLEMKTFLEMMFMSEWQQMLDKAASYLQSCLLHFSEINNRNIDYISIVTHDTEKLIENCGLAKNTPFILDLNQSVKASFGSILKKFSEVNFIKK